MTLVEKWTIAISAIGMLSTFTAVLVALYQSRIPYKKKIKLFFSDETYISYNSNSIRYINLIINNVGNKRIIVKDWGIKLNQGFFIFILSDKAEPDPLKPLYPKLPYTLNPEESLTLLLRYDDFKKIIEDLKNNHKIDENKALKLVIFDTLNKKYFVNQKTNRLYSRK